MNSKAIEALDAEHRQALAAIIDAVRVPIGVEVFPVARIYDDLIFDCNQAFAKLLGQAREALMGQDVFALFPPYQADGLGSETKWRLAFGQAAGADIELSQWRLQLGKELVTFDIKAKAITLQGLGTYHELGLHPAQPYYEEINRLKLNENRLKIFADNTPGLTKMSNVNNYYYFFNKNWQNFAGVESHEALSATWIDYIKEGELSGVLASIDAAYKKRQKYKVEYHLRDLAGAYRLFEDYGEPYYDSNGFFMGYVSSAVDVTDERRLASITQQLEINKEVNRQIRQTVDGTQLMVIGISADDRIVYLNKFAAGVLAGQAEVLQAAVEAVFAYELPEGSGRLHAFITRNIGQRIALRTRPQLSLEGGEKIFNCAIMYLGIQEATSDVVYLVGEDITEAEIQREVADQKEKKFQDVISSMQDLYFRIDKRLNLLEVNTHSADLLGYTPGELIGKSILDKVLQLSKQTRRQILKNRENKSFIIKVVNKAGEKIIFDCKIKPILDPDTRELTFVGVAKDLTELLNNQQKLKEKNKKILKLAESKDQFLANMSHEIRTPLNGIIGLVDLLSASRLQHPLDDYVATIKSSSESLLRIINDILDLSKLEAGKFVLTARPFDLKVAMQQIVQLYKPLALAKSLELEIVWKYQGPTRIVGDEIRIMQIVGNLVSNAIKFTEKGYIHLSVAGAEAGQEGGPKALTIAVEDSGVGIPLARQESLFKAFSQLDASTTKAAEGTGLGLFISKSLVQLMGGTIGFASQEGGGSSFYFTIPLVVEPDAGQTTMDYSASQSITAYSVLVVDDNKTNLKVGQVLLEHLGCTVETAASGQEALEVLSMGKHFDLILLDIQMPGMDGIATQAAIREGGLGQCPVFAMTAYSMRGDAEKYLALGFDGYVSKPINLESLRAALGRLDNLTQVQTEPQAPGDASAMPLLDAAVVEQLHKHLPWEALEEMYQQFFEEAKGYVLAITDGTDAAAIHDAAHALKGAAGTVGLPALAQLALEVESASSSAGFVLSPGQAEALANLYGRSRTFVFEHLVSKGNNG